MFLFCPANPAVLGSAYKYKPFPFATRFINADVRLQISGLNILQDCHKDHLQDEQEPHEYVCDAIRQSNEPQGQREICRNPQDRDVSFLHVLCACLQQLQYLRGPFLMQYLFLCYSQTPLKRVLISGIFFHPS